MAFPNIPPFTDTQRMQLRLYMGYSKLFTSSNSIFEGILDEIQDVPDFDDGSTFNQIIVVMQQLQNLDQLILNNSNLGLATMVQGKVTYDSYRNDRILRSTGRALIRQLSIMFSMKPSQDYYARTTPSTSGNIMPVAYDYDTSGDY